MTRNVIEIAPIPAPDVKQQLLALESSGLLSGVAGCYLSETGVTWRLVDSFSSATWRHRSKIANRLVVRGVSRWSSWPSVLLANLWMQYEYRRAPSHIKCDKTLEIYDQFASRMISSKTRAVVGREDCCEQSFLKAKALGVNRIYDLPTLYCDSVKSILEKEVAEFPQAEPGADPADVFSRDRCERKQRELLLATHVVVASELVRKSIGSTIPLERVSVLPYGFEHVEPGATVSLSRQRSNIVIFGGNITMRKGVPRLLRAWKRIGAHRTHRLKLYGGMYLSQAFLADYRGTFEHIPRVSRSVMRDALCQAKGLVMPSIADGFGLIVSEALSVGTPVVISNNTGIAELIDEGIHGYRYEYDNDDGLCGALEKLLGEGHRGDCMSAACLELAKAQTWASYRARFSNLVQ